MAKPSLRDIFDAALQIDSENERREYLDNTCGDDDALRAEVEELLKSHESAGSFMQDDADPEATHLLSGMSESVGTEIGPLYLTGDSSF